MINWTPELLASLKLTYALALKTGASKFGFRVPGMSQPVDMLTDYAKYLIEYLETVFGVENKSKPN